MSCIGNSGPAPASRCTPWPTTSSWPACFPATATSRAAFRRTCRRTTSMQPANVIAYAIAGTMDIDLENDPLGTDAEGNPVFLRRHRARPTTRWPRWWTQFVTRRLVRAGRGGHVRGRRRVAGPRRRAERHVRLGRGLYLRAPAPLLRRHGARAVAGQAPIEGARVLGNFGDFITTDHISPAGVHRARLCRRRAYLRGPWRGSGRLQHLRQPSRQPRGDDARHLRQREAAEQAGRRPQGRLDARLHHGRDRAAVLRGRELPRGAASPAAVACGQDVRLGSARATGRPRVPMLLGVRVAIAESFERIHRSNLIGMGILPLQFVEGQNADDARASTAPRSSPWRPIDFSAGLPSPAVVQVTAETRRRQRGDLRRHGAHRHAHGGPLLRERRHPPVRPARFDRRSHTLRARRVFSFRSRRFESDYS